MISFIFSIILFANAFADPNAQTAPPANNVNGQRSLSSNFIQPSSYESDSSSSIYGGGGFSSLVAGGSSSGYSSGGGSIVRGAIGGGSSGSLSHQRISGSQSRITGGSSEITSGLGGIVSGEYVKGQLGGISRFESSGNTLLPTGYDQSSLPIYADNLERQTAIGNGEISSFNNRGVSSLWSMLNGYPDSSSTFDQRKISNLVKLIKNNLDSSYEKQGVSSIWDIIKAYLGSSSSHNSRGISSLMKIFNGYSDTTSSYPNWSKFKYPLLETPILNPKKIMYIRGIPTLVASPDNNLLQDTWKPIYPLDIPQTRPPPGWGPSPPLYPSTGRPHPWKPSLPFGINFYSGKIPSWIYPDWSTSTINPNYPRFSIIVRKAPSLWEQIPGVGSSNFNPTIEKPSRTRIIPKGLYSWVVPNDLGSRHGIGNLLPSWNEQIYRNIPNYAWSTNQNTMNNFPNPWEISPGLDRSPEVGNLLSEWHKRISGTTSAPYWNRNPFEKPSNWIPGLGSISGSGSISGFGSSSGIDSSLDFGSNTGSSSDFNSFGGGFGFHRGSSFDSGYSYPSVTFPDNLFGRGFTQQ